MKLRLSVPGTLLFLGSSIAVFLLLVYLLRLGAADLRVPFNYWGDTLWFLVPVKGILSNGWAYQVPQLSAPFSLSAVAFPSITNVDWLVMKLIGWVFPEPGMVLNLFWLLTFFFTTWSAAMALRLIGVAPGVAYVLGVVYAFFPSAFMRNTAHISLVYYWVPALGCLAIYFAQGCVHPQEKWVKVFGYMGIIGQGLSYLYFSYYAVLLFAFAGLIGYATTRSNRVLRESFLAIVVLVLVSGVNLAPSFLSWHQQGKPPNIEYKSAQEAEVYAFKLRKLVAPHKENQVPGFGLWGRSDSAVKFPNENENVFARLGPVAAMGLLIVLIYSLGLVRNRENLTSPIVSIASLALFTFLLGTVGGLGAIINQIVPDFRAYNRLSVYLGFFAIAAVGLLLSSWLARVRGGFTKGLVWVTFLGVCSFSLYDQGLDAEKLVSRRPGDEEAARRDRELVQLLESKITAPASVFQLPLTGFPPDGGMQRMLPYDHARPFIWSTKLSWSWPSFSHRHASWLANLDLGNPGKTLKLLALSGFRFIWVDRDGFADNGERVIRGLMEAGAEDFLPNASQRYLVLDISGPSDRLKTELGESRFHDQSLAYLDVPWLVWKDGMYAQETTAQGRSFRWLKQFSQAEVRYSGPQEWRGRLLFDAASSKAGAVEVAAGEEKVSTMLMDRPKQISVPLVVKPNQPLLVEFVGSMGRINPPPGETRDLHYYLLDSRFVPEVATP